VLRTGICTPFVDWPFDYGETQAEGKLVTHSIVTEDDLVRAIRRVLSGDLPGVLVPVGDDAAVVEPGKQHLVLTADMLVEGVHFDIGIVSAHDLGHKSITASVSDIAAMGGSPRYALVSLGLPRAVEMPWVMELYGGVRDAADEYGMAVVGGDLSRSEGHVVSVAAMGTMARGKAITRSGARPGDQLVVTGTLGAANGGLRLAKEPPHDVRGALGSEWGRELVQAFLRPVARVGEGETLAQAGASAMIDVSDGLALDLSRLCTESKVGAALRLADVPVSPALEELRSVLDVNPLDQALHGGEDYELLACLPPEAVAPARERLRDRFGTPLTPVGEITDDGLVAVWADGTNEPLEPRGWDHFA
jgi:thiamine-monophosphate kinase